MTSENSSPTVLIVSGTNRPGSNALRVARVIEGHYAAAGVRAQVLSLEELPPEAFLPSASPPSVRLDCPPLT